MKIEIKIEIADHAMSLDKNPRVIGLVKSLEESTIKIDGVSITNPKYPKYFIINEIRHRINHTNGCAHFRYNFLNNEHIINIKKINENKFTFIFINKIKISESRINFIEIIKDSGYTFQTRIDLNEEQKKLVNYSFNEPLIIQGPAGSGKTTIAIHRALFFLEEYFKKNEHKRVILLVFNKKIQEEITELKKYIVEEYYNSDKDFLSYIELNFDIKTIDQKLNDLWENYYKFDNPMLNIFSQCEIIYNYNDERIEFNPIDVDVKRFEHLKFHGYEVNTESNRIYSKKGISSYAQFLKIKAELKEVKIISKNLNKALNGIINRIKLSSLMENKFINSIPNNFLLDLFNKVLLDKEYTQEHFKKFKFRNLHVLFTENDKEDLWSFFEKYLVEIQVSGLSFFELSAINLVTDLPDFEKYDYVICDEVQDFSLPLLAAALGLISTTKKSLPVTLLFDHSQSIFNPFFSWRSCFSPLMYSDYFENIKSIKLSYSYRCPNNISLIANHVAKLTKRKMSGKVSASDRIGLVRELAHDDRIPKDVTSISFNKNEDSITIHKSKGLSFENILLDEISLKTLRFHIYHQIECLKLIHYPNPIDEIMIESYFLELIYLSFMNGTRDTSLRIDEIIKYNNEHGMSLSYSNTLNRSSRFFLSEIDNFLCCLYVAITRTKNNFYYRYSKNINEDELKILSELFSKLEILSRNTGQEAA